MFSFDVTIAGEDAVIQKSAYFMLTGSVFYFLILISASLPVDVMQKPQQWQTNSWLRKYDTAAILYQRMLIFVIGKSL